MATENSKEIQWYQNIYNQVSAKYKKTGNKVATKDIALISSDYFVVTRVLERTYKKLGKSIC